MIRRLAVPMIAIAVVGLVVSGTAGGDEMSILQLAELHLSAVVTVQRWTEFAYGLRPTGNLQCEPIPSYSTFGPDGSITIHFRNPDCTTGTSTSWPMQDRSFITRLQYPDGLEETIQAEVGQPFPGASAPLGQFASSHT